MRARLARLLVLVLGVLLLIVLGLGLMLGSSSGTRWLLAQVPGLSTQALEGSLLGRLSAQDVRWEDQQNSVSLTGLELNWSPWCLLRLTVCVEQLSLEQLSLQLKASSEDDSTPFELPSIVLPLAFEIKQLSLGQLLLDDDLLLAHLALKASSKLDEVKIDALSVESAGLVLEAAGTLRLSEQWPVNLTATLQLPEVDNKAWHLLIHTQGELKQSLEVSALSHGYLEARLSGQVQPLKEGLPAQATVISDAFRAAAELPDTLVLEAVEISAKGTLVQGYEVMGHARLPAHGEPMQVSVQGRVDAAGADIAQLLIDAGPEKSLKADGHLDWSKDFSAQIKLLWQAFAWQSLYPLESPPPVELQHMQASFNYQSGHFGGDLAAQLQGPAGAFTLQTPYQSDGQSLHLPALKLEAGKGRIEGELALDFAPVLQWKAALDVVQFDPGYWLAQLPGMLAGTVNSHGQFADDELQLVADVGLSGRLRGVPAQLNAKGQISGSTWRFNDLLVQMGNNRIHANAQSEQGLKAQLALDLARLDQLWPGLAGQAKGSLDVQGTLSTPQGSLVLNAQRLRLNDVLVAQAGLNAELNARQQAELSLDVQELTIGQTDLGRLQVQGQGDVRKQSLKLDLQGPQLELEFAADGQLSEDHHWQGWISALQIQSGGQYWHLSNHASLVRTPDGQIKLGAHCLTSGSAKLCGAEQKLAPEQDLDWELSDFPLDTLEAWLPEDFAWQGLLNGRIKVALSDDGPNGVIRLNAGQGSLRVLESDLDQWVDFPYQQMALEAVMTPRQIRANLSFDSQRLGQLRAALQLDPRVASKPLSGEFSLRNFDLEVLRPFVPLAEHMGGSVNGSGTLGGVLLAPQVFAQIRLEDGELSGAQLPISLQDANLHAVLKGDQLELSGQWRSGENGSATLKGAINWREGLSGAIDFDGNALPVIIAPYAELEVQPQMTFEFIDNKLLISGHVAVPRGAITVRELPPSTVKVSSDAYVVGEPSDFEQDALGVGMNITVEVGQDLLTFTGFGLTAELNGRLHIGDDLDARGEVELVKGRYSAYGQRLTIRRARLLFTGPIDQPFLDIEAVRRVDNVVAGIRLSGSADQPRTTVFSEPAMSEEQALSYLVLGRPMGGGAGDGNMLGQAALAIGLAGSTSITSGLASRLGIRDFELESEGSGVTTSVVASGDITDKLSLRYGVGIFEPNGILALRYQLTRKWYIEAASGLASSIDVFYRTEF